ncbi:cytochrome c [Brevirhabdus pacifica]|nr:cytochrome c [Brevirhabdus pacifica]
MRRTILRTPPRLPSDMNGRPRIPAPLGRPHQGARAGGLGLATLCAGLVLGAGMAGAAEFFTLKGHGGPVKGLAEATDGSAILTASFDYSVGLWHDGQPRWLEKHRAAVNAVEFAGPGRAISGGDDFDVILWDLDAPADDDPGKVLGRHAGKVIALDVSADATMAASASWDGTVGLWPLPAPGETASGATRAGRLLKGHDAGVNDVLFSADGSRLYSASADGTILVWDVAAGEPLRQLVRHGFGVNTMVLNEAEGWLAYGAVDGVTRIVDATTGDEIADFTLERRPILAMAGDPGFTTLAVGDGEGFIMLIDTASWTITRDFRATLKGPVWALAFSADGSSIHAGGLDDAAYSWPVGALDEPTQMVRDARSFLRPPEEMSNGERQFQRKCSICHSLTPGSARRAGPSLAGLFGRRAGSVADYSYSPILTGSDIVWNDDTIDRLFDIGPDHYIPGSKMPMQRITGAGDRADLIAFLRHATGAGSISQFKQEDTK